MKCPNCRLINPDKALYCDCGYDFQKGFVDRSLVEKTPQKPPPLPVEKVPVDKAERDLYLKVRNASWVLFLYAAVSLIVALVALGDNGGSRAGSEFLSNIATAALINCLVFLILGALALTEKAAVISLIIAALLSVLDLGWYLIQFLSLTANSSWVMPVLWLKIGLTGAVVRGLEAAYDLKSRTSSTNSGSNPRGPLGLS